MTTYQHFILTAFNVDFNKKSRTEILDEEYLEKRFLLFENICFPSVVGQINQNFKWLVLFDREIGDRFKEKIKNLCQYQNFTPVYTPPNCSEYKVFANVVREHLLDTTKHAITSNLDNDDALSNDFTKLVQDNYCEQDFEFINFPFGLMMSQHFVLLREYLSNPFLSLIEKIENNEQILTCRIIPHTRLDRLSKQGLPTRQIINHPTWLQIVHDTNQVNRLDFNASIVSKNNIDRYFKMGSNFTDKYFTKQDWKIATKYFIKSLLKKRIPLSKRIRNGLNAISPWFSILYLSITLKNQKSYPEKLSFQDAKNLCYNYSKYD